MKPEVICTFYEESAAKRRLPLNLNQKDLPLFEGELERVIPATRLLQFPEVLVSPEGLLFKGTQILPESFAFPYHLDEWRSRSVLKFLATNYAFRLRRKIEQEVLWITDYWSTGYFHWLADALTRLFVVRGTLSHAVVLLPGKYEAHEHVQSSLRAFGVTNVRFIGRHEVVRCRSLLMPSPTAPSGHFNWQAIRGVRRVLLEAYGDVRRNVVEDAEDKRLYISRRRAGRRRIINEDEVTSVLRAFRFETVCAEELSFEQQAQTFSLARYIVSNHGAGLTNMLFMKDRGSVLELRHEGDCVNNCYFTLASALDLNYFYQTCAPEDPSADPHDAHLVVDLDRLEKNVRLLLANA
jgi:capsular polysaccharide biosynthesis protein